MLAEVAQELQAEGGAMYKGHAGKIAKALDMLPAEATPAGPFTDARVAGRSCQNCHAQIHGSNHPAGVRMHR